MNSLKYQGVIWSIGHKTLLRPVEKADLPHVMTWINDPEIRRFMLNRGPISELYEERWLERISEPGPDMTLAVCLLDGTLIGTMGLHQVNLRHHHGTTGSMIGPHEYRGKGYGSDAKMQLLNFAFNETGLRKVMSRVIAFNTRSAAYSAKCGYREEARLRAQIFSAGKWHDEIILSVFRDDWLPLWEKYLKEGE
jgi:RimJ/RimL family protein N-acetyltransferase